MESFIKETIVQAGEAIMPLFGKVTVDYVKEKATDIVTRADLISQEIIIGAIEGKHPDHGIISEESDGYEADADYVWYLDPLDGTKNFASGVPLFGINIALAHKGQIKHAAIYLPATEELCYAESGLGAYLNNKKIICSGKKEWRGSYGLGPPGAEPQYLKFLGALGDISDGTGWVNSIGSPAICGVWIADGRRDWYLGPSKNSWDYAAPYLIAKEAGCMVSNFAGGDWHPGDQGLVIANQYLYPELLKLVKISFN